MLLEYFGNEFSGSNIFCMPIPLKFFRSDASENEHQDKQECRWSAKTQLTVMFITSFSCTRVSLQTTKMNIKTYYK